MTSWWLCVSLECDLIGGLFGCDLDQANVVPFSDLVLTSLLRTLTLHCWNWTVTTGRMRVKCGFAVANLRLWKVKLSVTCPGWLTWLCGNCKWTWRSWLVYSFLGKKDGLLRRPVLPDGMDLLWKTCTHEVFSWQSEIAMTKAAKRSKASEKRCLGTRRMMTDA
jgi:hypothetical protein